MLSCLSLVQGEFCTQMFKLKEMKTQKDEELEGGWYTEERMERVLGYSKWLSLKLTLVSGSGTG